MNINVNVNCFKAVDIIVDRLYDAAEMLEMYKSDTSVIDDYFKGVHLQFNIDEHTVATIPYKYMQGRSMRKDLIAQLNENCPKSFIEMGVGILDVNLVHISEDATTHCVANCRPFTINLGYNADSDTYNLENLYIQRGDKEILFPLYTKLGVTPCTSMPSYSNYRIFGDLSRTLSIVDNDEMVNVLADLIANTTIEGSGSMGKFTVKVRDLFDAYHPSLTLAQFVKVVRTGLQHIVNAHYARQTAASGYDETSHNHTFCQMSIMYNDTLVGCFELTTQHGVTHDETVKPVQVGFLYQLKSLNKFNSLDTYKELVRMNLEAIKMPVSRAEQVKQHIVNPQLIKAVECLIDIMGDDSFVLEGYGHTFSADADKLLEYLGNYTAK